MKYAFRCKNCGHLHHADHAGLNDLPHSCCVCGKGVETGFDPKAFAERLRKPMTDQERLALAEELSNTVQKKQLDPNNWEVLATCDEPKLAKYGLKPHDVEAHSPKSFALKIAKDAVIDSKQVAVLATDGLAAKDKVG